MGHAYGPNGPSLNSRRARELRRELISISSRAHVLARARDIDCARDIGRDLERGLARSLDLARDIDLAHDIDRVDDIDQARNFVRDLEQRLTRSLDLVRDIDHALAHDRALGLIRARTLVREIAHARDTALNYGSLEVVTFNYVRDLFRTQGARKQREAGRVAPSASRLLAAAARLLPAADRARYAEEYWSELWEISRAGGHRRAQLAYAARQLMAAWRLRGELRVPRRRGAVP